jgi:hypothetical protein
MKAILFSRIKWSIIASLLAFTLPVEAQDNDTSRPINDWIGNRHFIFRAQSATPQTGGFIQLTSLYDIRISNDSVISNLPYYGRAFVAPINPQDGGLTFTTTDIDYGSKKAGDDKWEVNITAKALRDNYKLFFTIYTNGQAQLQVTSNNRQPIRFDGYVVDKSIK